MGNNTTAFFTALSLFFSTMLNAWWPVCHYAIARECGVPHDEAGLYNLPDAWKSYEWFYLEGVALKLYAITDNFCWSHGVARTGRTTVAGMAVGIPLIPEYHLEREPGEIIRSLISNGKVNHWGTSSYPTGTLATAVNTAKYMTGHNAADHYVHWSYFSGGSINGWDTQHKIKEEWADYAILLYKNKITFKLNGDIETFWGNAVTSNTQPMPFDITKVNCYSLQLAQMVTRKNRAFLEEADFTSNTGNPCIYNAVNTVSQILGKVSNLADNINESVREMNQDRADELQETAMSKHWMFKRINPSTGKLEDDYSTLISHFTLSKINFQYYIP